MSAITTPLIHDHHHCDDLYVAAENTVASGDWSQANEHFQRFSTDLARHFQAEEQILFPAFEAATGMQGGPTAVMRGEHVQMRELLASMGEALARQDGKGYLGRAETLLMLMRQHNLKEENILYPMANQALRGEQETLTARLVSALR